MLFQRNNNTTSAPEQISERTHHVRLYKRIAYGSAAMLALLLVPFAVEALNGEDAANDRTPAAILSQSVGTHQSSVAEETPLPPTSPSKPGHTNSSNVTLDVNGRPVAVPQNGSTHEKMHSSDRQTVVDVSVQNHQSGSAHTSTNSSTSIEVNVHTDSTGDDAHGGGRHPDRR